jgi:hypothetical protein
MLLRPMMPRALRCYYAAVLPACCLLRCGRLRCCAATAAAAAAAAQGDQAQQRVWAAAAAAAAQGDQAQQRVASRPRCCLCVLPLLLVLRRRPPLRGSPRRVAE